MSELEQSPLDQCYQACGLLETRIVELKRLLAEFSAHCMNYPALYTRGEAWKWVEEGQRLIEQAEKLQKEGNHV